MHRGKSHHAACQFFYRTPLHTTGNAASGHLTQAHWAISLNPPALIEGCPALDLHNLS